MAFMPLNTAPINGHSVRDLYAVGCAFPFHALSATGRCWRSSELPGKPTATLKGAHFRSFSGRRHPQKESCKPIPQAQLGRRQRRFTCKRVDKSHCLRSCPFDCYEVPASHTYTCNRRGWKGAGTQNEFHLFSSPPNGTREIPGLCSARIRIAFLSQVPFGYALAKPTQNRRSARRSARRKAALQADVSRALILERRRVQRLQDWLHERDQRYDREHSWHRCATYSGFRVVPRLDRPA